MIVPTNMTTKLLYVNSIASLENWSASCNYKTTATLFFIFFKKKTSSSSSSTSSKSITSSFKDSSIVLLQIATPTHASLGHFLQIITTTSKFVSPNLHLHKLVKTTTMDQIHSHSIWMHGIPRICFAKSQHS